MIVYDGTAPDVESFVLGPGNPSATEQPHRPAAVAMTCCRCGRLACACTVPPITALAR